MRLYEFTIPTHDNAGRSYEQARKRWEAHAIAAAGGLTIQPGFAQGVWVDDGKEYRDQVTQYRVACEESTFKLLLAHAFECFPDQLAIFTADLGEATIHERPKAAA